MLDSIATHSLYTSKNIKKNIKKKFFLCKGTGVVTKQQKNIIYTSSIYNYINSIQITLSIYILIYI